MLVGHAIDFSIALNCIMCLDDHLLDKCSLWSFLNDYSCLIAFYLFLYVPCLQLVTSLMKKKIFVQVFQDTSVYGASASQLLELGVSEFCLCF